MRTALILISLVLIGSARLAAQGTVRLNGATTTVNVVLTPANREALERDLGLALAIVGSGTGKGLADLADGRCDASLTSEPLDIAVAAAKAAGKEIDPATLNLHQITTAEIVFVVHPSNPVDALTFAQIKGIHLGTIANWKEVGGPDMPIAVFSDAPTGGTRAMVKKLVLGGDEYGTVVRAQTAVKVVAEQVAQLKGGFGGVGGNFADPAKVKVIRTEAIVRPLGLITIGDPSPAVAKVIAALRARFPAR